MRISQRHGFRLLQRNLRPRCAFSRTVRFAISKRRSSHVVRNGQSFRMAVIGSGPAGFYSAYKVMSGIEDAVVDMYEQLPVPFGLVRFGVAPDHPEVKNCEDKFSEVAMSPRFNFIGNVDVGRDLPLSRLRNHYDAILFSYGASKDRRLGVPGEGLSGVYSARDFVGWYNGLPENSTLNPDLESGDEAVIIGQGNVALDVARTLLTGVDMLKKTDMTDYALASLARSKIKRVHVVGRRGPMQVAFTIKEVRELLRLPSVSFEPIHHLLPNDISKLSRTPKRLTQLLANGSPTVFADAPKSWALRFLLSPTAFNAIDDVSNDLGSISFLKNELQGTDMYDASARVTSTSETVTIPTSLAFRSIGYKSEAINGMEGIGIDFDTSKGIIPNDYYGRVIGPSSDQKPKDMHQNILPGLYCSGWVKRGPAGVIANTMEDSFATAEAIVSDWKNKRRFLGGGNGWDSLVQELTRQVPKIVHWNDWRKIDAAEKERGKDKGKERERFTSTEEMLSILD